MSFHLNPQTKLTFDSGDHINHDGLLVSMLIPITLDLFDTKQSPSSLEFQDNFPKRKKQKKCLLEDHNCEENMNNKNENNNITGLDLGLNLSPPSSEVTDELSPGRSPSISPTSPCVSSSPKATPMVLVGCPRCLMYVMLSQDDTKCPKCKSTVILIDLLHGNHKDDDNGDNNYRGNDGSFNKIKKS